MDDPKVRQALNYAIDKRAIARDVLPGLEIPAKGILPPGFPGYNPDLSGYPYDPERARQLLTESKYGADLPNLPSIILTTAGGGSGVGQDLEVILEMWRQNLGIEATIQQVEFATFLQDLIARRFQMFKIGWVADYPDPENFLDQLFHSGSSNNHTGYNNPEVDRFLETARVEAQQDVRYELYRQAEQLIINDAPLIPLWHSGGDYFLIKPYVRDYHLTPLLNPKLRYVYLTKTSSPPPTPTPMPAPSSIPAPPGLVSWWPGDGNATDIWGDNDGTLTGDFVQGMVGPGFGLDGVGDHVLVPDSADLNITGDVTVDLWARQTVTQQRRRRLGC